MEVKSKFKTTIDAETPRQRQNVFLNTEWEISSDVTRKLQIPDKFFNYPNNITIISSSNPKSVCVTERSTVTYPISTPELGYHAKKASYNSNRVHPFKYDADGNCVSRFTERPPKIETLPIYSSTKVQVVAPVIQEVSSVRLVDDSGETPYTQRKIQVLSTPPEINFLPENPVKIEEIPIIEEHKISAIEENPQKKPQSKKTSEISFRDSDSLFDITTYKTKKCRLGLECTGRCNDFHFEGERRRNPLDFFYMPQLCKDIPNCKSGDHCTKAHNAIEVIYHPQMYLSHFCPYSDTSVECVLGKACNFKHLEKKLKSKCPQEFLGKIYEEFAGDENGEIGNKGQEADGNRDNCVEAKRTKERPMDEKRVNVGDWDSA